MEFARTWRRLAGWTGHPCKICHLRYCDRLLPMSGGRVAADGSLEAVVTEVRLRDNFP